LGQASVRAVVVLVQLLDQQAKAMGGVAVWVSLRDITCAVAVSQLGWRMACAHLAVMSFCAQVPGG